MKNKMKIIVSVMFLILFISFTSFVSAEQQTQQFNKIFLSPFYQPSLTQNLNYSYNLTVNPPDGISQVSSAIIVIDAYINPTRTFTVLINNQTCNNPTYTVSTTYSGAGKSTVYFDCSNRITRTGTYEVKISVSGGNIGSTTAWLDLTYMNKAAKKIDIFGTEYTIGDNGKVFVQLLENQLTPINNASCYISVYYPNGVKWVDESIMTYQTGSTGLYYYDFTAPSSLGVYMTEIFCEYYTLTTSTNASAYALTYGWYVNGTGASLTNIDSNYLTIVEKNSNTGAHSNVTTLLMAHLDEYSGTSTLDSSASPTTGTHFNSPTIGVPGQVGSAGVRYGVGTNDYTNFAAATKLNLASNEAYMVCFSFNQSASNANGNRLISAESGDVIRFSYDGGNHIRFVSDRSGTGAQTIETTGTYIDSQFHTVCGFANFTRMRLYIDGSLLLDEAKTQSGTLTLSNGFTIGAVLGGGNDIENTVMDEVCYIKGTDANFASPSPSTLATNYNTYKQCGTPKYNLDVNTTISGITLVPEYHQADIVTRYTWSDFGELVDVYLWNYTGSSWYKLANSLSYNVVSDGTVSSALTNISSFVSGGNMIVRYNDSDPNHYTAGTLRLNQVRLDQINFVEVPINQIRGGGEIHVNNIPGATWNYPTRTLTAYPNITASIDTSAVAAAVWNNSDRNLTYYADVTNYTLVGESVWTSSATISVGLLNQIAAAIWSAPDRNLTYYPTQVDLTNYTLIAETVWNSANRNLTYYQNFGDQTNYTLLELYFNQVPPAVWNYTDRNLTYYQNFGDQTDYDRIILGVWNATTRNLTYYPAQVDLTNYSLIIGETANAVWNATDRNLTYYPQQMDLTNYSQVAEVVWNAANRNLTYYQDVTDYNQIIVGVWNATDRNLTFYPAQVDLTNYTLISDTVWSASNRSLTFYADVTNYTFLAETVWGSTATISVNLLDQIATAVWTAPDRNLTYYEQIDLTNYTQVAESVWNAAIRNLTYYPQQIDLTNYTLVGDYVWTRTDRNLTFYQDVTDYDRIIVGVWNNTDRNLTYYPAQVDQTNYTLIIEGTSQAVWNVTDRNLTYYPAQVDLTNYTQIADYVWNAASRNLTYYEHIDMTNYTEIIVGVWNATTRNLTYYPAQVDLTNYTEITENVVGGVWNATDRNLTYYPQQIDLTNYSQIADVVWNAGNRNLTYTEDVTDYDRIIVGVWNATDRNLTFYPAQVDLTNYTKIAEDTAAGVWLYSDRNLTYYEHIDMTNYTLIQQVVWENLNRTLTDFDFTVDVNETEISNAVWTAVDRTLTSFNFTVNAEVNNTAIADAVWTAVNRSLTDYNHTAPTDLTDYNKIQQMVWNATDRNLTYYENFGDQTNYTEIENIVSNYSTPINYTLIQEMVWDATNRSLTEFGFDVNVNNTAIAEAVWTSVNRTLTEYPNQYDLTNYTLIQQVVWEATNRTLTSFDFTVNVNQTQLDNVVNYTLISDMVWNATQRTLTEFNFTIDVNTTAIADAVWASTNRTLSYYPEWADLTNYTLIQEVVWTNAVRTLTDFNFTVEATVNNSDVANAVWSYSNKTVDFATTGTTQNVSTVEDIANIGHTYVGGTEYLDGDAGKIAIRLVKGTGALAEVETGANCTVTLLYPNSTTFIFNQSMTEIGDGAYIYDFTVPAQLGIYAYYTNCIVEDRKYFSLNDFHVYQNDYSSIPTSVWNATTRTLTDNGNDITASDVWSYSTRELTYYPTANLTLSNESIQELGDAVWQYDGTISSNILTQFADSVTCTIQKLQSEINLKAGVQLVSC